jgi:hypothetical protein
MASTEEKKIKAKIAKDAFCAGWEKAIAACLAAQPSKVGLADESSYQRGRAEGIIEYRHAIEDLSDRFSSADLNDHIVEDLAFGSG